MKSMPLKSKARHATYHKRLKKKLALLCVVACANGLLGSCGGGGGGGGSPPPPPPPPAPTLAMSVIPSTIPLGKSATITWSSTNATSCSATWTGDMRTSSNGIGATVSPSTVGFYTYFLSCSGLGGSVTGSVTLEVATTIGVLFVWNQGNFDQADWQ
jgi:hypothetical protein